MVKMAILTVQCGEFGIILPTALIGYVDGGDGGDDEGGCIRYDGHSCVGVLRYAGDKGTREGWQQMCTVNNQRMITDNRVVYIMLATGDR